MCLASGEGRVTLNGAGDPWAGVLGSWGPRLDEKENANKIPVLLFLSFDQVT